MPSPLPHILFSDELGSGPIGCVSLPGVEKPTLALLYISDYRKYFETRDKLTQYVEPQRLSSELFECPGFSPEASIPRRVCPAYSPETDLAQAVPGGGHLKSQASSRGSLRSFRVSWPGFV